MNSQFLCVWKSLSSALILEKYFCLSSRLIDILCEPFKDIYHSTVTWFPLLLLGSQLLIQWLLLWNYSFPLVLLSFSLSIICYSLWYFLAGFTYSTWDCWASLIYSKIFLVITSSDNASSPFSLSFPYITPIKWVSLLTLPTIHLTFFSIFSIFLSLFKAFWMISSDLPSSSLNSLFSFAQPSVKPFNWILLGYLFIISRSSIWFFFKYFSAPFYNFLSLHIFLGLYFLSLNTVVLVVFVMEARLWGNTSDSKIPMA